MNNRKWVESTILGIIILNVFVMGFVFFIPRVQFMAKHWGWKAEAKKDQLKNLHSILFIKKKMLHIWKNLIIIQMIEVIIH